MTDIDWRPGETATHMLLWSALERIGKHRFAEWSGGEYAVGAQATRDPLPPLSDKSVRDKTMSLIRARMKLKPTSEPVTGAEFASAKEQVERELELAHATLSRWQSVCAEFHRAAALAEIETAIRREGSFNLSALPSDLWAVANPRIVFVHLRLDPDEPASNAFGGRNFHAVLVKRESLQDYLNPLGVAPDELAADEKGEAGGEWWRGGVLRNVIDAAVVLLTQDNLITRDRMLANLQPKWPDLTLNFLRQRIWSPAREAVGLDPDGTPGKRKVNSAG